MSIDERKARIRESREWRQRVYLAEKIRPNRWPRIMAMITIFVILAWMALGVVFIGSLGW